MAADHSGLAPSAYETERRDKHRSSGIRNECNLPQANRNVPYRCNAGRSPFRAIVCFANADEHCSSLHPFPSGVVGCGVGNAPQKRNDPFHRAVEDAGPYGTRAPWPALRFLKQTTPASRSVGMPAGGLTF
ncbi:MAG: hypothetical protein IKS21_04215 [Oscillospiraceae bacterium]|nr:hypothetical protein [Oscillospiraceae bacterium]